MITLDQLNGAATRAEFAALLDGTFEHSPWIAERAFDRRPFRSVAQLQHAFAVVLREAGRDAQLALIRAHPELAGKAMVSGTLDLLATLITMTSSPAGPAAMSIQPEISNGRAGSPSFSQSAVASPMRTCAAAFG